MATLTTLASFNGDDGAHPVYGSLMADAAGNLYGTTLSGGATGDGTVFELVNTGSGFTFQTLASLNYTSGSAVFAGLTIDANGNLFGTAQSGGTAGYGAVFELANTGSGYTLSTVASFTQANGAYPTGTLTADAAGNLWGTTQAGGANSQGSVFELVNTGSGYSLQTQYSFNFSDGAAPTGPLIADANGNLFGATLQGGSGGVGTVFELVNTGSGLTYTPLHAFSGADGSYLYAGLTADAHGDLFGTTYSGGAHGYGTVFELVNTGSGYTFQTLASLDYDTTGGYVMAGVSIDAQGDLFGAALAGGAGGFGTVFELVNTGSGYGPVQVVYAFSGSDGAQPKSAPIIDASGNLYGTTAGGGPDGAGTVYEISFGTSGEQAALALKVNGGGSGAPVGEAGSTHVGFTVAGMAAGDTGTVTFTDQANHTVVVQVIGGQTQYSADFSSLADGAVSASLQVATNAGGDSFTPVAGNSVTLDTVAPAQPGEPSDASVAGGYVNDAHDTADQTIVGTAEAGSGITIYDNGVQVAQVTADTTGAWSWQAGVLGDGAHSLTVTATDLAGNTSAASDALTFTVDTAAPAKPGAPADAPVHGGSLSVASNTADQSITGTTEAGATVAVYDNGAQVGTATADGSGAWSYKVGILAEGSSHSYAVTATDAAGNASGMSDALSFTVETPPPPTTPATPDAPTDSSVINGYVDKAHDTAGQTIGGVAEAGSSVTVYDKGVQVATVTADDTGAWSYQVGVLRNGSAHSYTVTATNGGGTSAMSDPLTFAVDTTAPRPPAQLADASVINGYVNKAHDTAAQTLTGTAEQGAVVTVYDNGTQLGTAAADASTGAWSFQLGVLADGKHEVTATAIDAAGNTGRSSSALIFKVDTQVPIPVVDAVRDAPRGMSTVSGAAEAGSTVTLFDGGKQVGVTTAGHDGKWSVTLKLNGGSTHQFTETAVDLAGNVGVSAGVALWANAGARQLVGGAGNDVLIGQKGDVLTGGAGHDHFVLGTDFAKATITDFTPGSDRIGISHAMANAAWIMAHARASHGDTLISFGNGSSLTLQGVAPSSLHAGDFFFT